jgi:hypothetical protein
MKEKRIFIIPVLVSMIQLEQANMTSPIKFIFRNGKVAYIKSFSVCSPDTSLYIIQNIDEYDSMNFDNNFILWVFLVDKKNPPKDILDNYLYRRYMYLVEKEKEYNNQKIKFRTTRP